MRPREYVRRLHLCSQDLTKAGVTIVQSPVLPVIVKRLLVTAYTSLAQNYLDATEGRRMCFKITAINAAVWLLWKLPSARIAMMTSFTHNPLSGLSYTLLTSMFRYRLFPDIAIVLQRRWKNDL